jgi:hypothetical protein
MTLHFIATVVRTSYLKICTFALHTNTKCWTWFGHNLVIHHTPTNYSCKHRSRRPTCVPAPPTVRLTINSTTGWQYEEGICHHPNYGNLFGLMFIMRLIKMMNNIFLTFKIRSIWQSLLNTDSMTAASAIKIRRLSSNSILLTHTVLWRS